MWQKVLCFTLVFSFIDFICTCTNSSKLNRCVFFRINNCVGQENHYAFIQLLFYAFLLSGLSLILAVLHFFAYEPCTLCDQVRRFSRSSQEYYYLL
jgi:hypothetical protein